jgi:hypothetical protein
VLGETQTVTLISGTPNNTLTSPGWDRFQNGIYQYPNTAIINSQGCYVSHVWSEDTNQFPSVHWRTNVSTNLDMSDYNITSISLEIMFNASVNTNVDTPNDPYPLNWYFGTGDYIEFYAMISDIYYDTPYTVAYNKTKYLGQNSGPTITTLNNSLLFTYDDKILIDALKVAFEKDPDHSNFTMILGMNIYSEDNYQSTDTDTYNDLFFKTCNLTITYEKIVDELTTISWNQVSEPIIGENLRISEAFFNFKYKVDKLWPETAPLSELKFYINDKLYTEETIKLSLANTSFKDASSGGFDVTRYLDKDINISISIELFLKETFELEEIFTISIDDVYLYIKIEEIQDVAYPLIYTLGGAMIGLVVAFGLYFKIFQYPPLVRKIKKLKSKIRKGRKTKPVLIASRVNIIENYFQETLTPVNIETFEYKKVVDDAIREIDIKNETEGEEA